MLISGIRSQFETDFEVGYVEAARAHEGRILVSHALRNAMIPVITILGLTFAALLGGAILTEVTFSWPGLANRLYRAIAQRDYPTVQGIVVFFAAIVSLTSIGVDLLNAYIDPRIRY